MNKYKWRKYFYFGKERQNVCVLERKEVVYICRLFGYEFRFTAIPTPLRSRPRIIDHIEARKEFYTKQLKRLKDDVDAYDATTKWLINQLRNRGLEMYPAIKPVKNPDDAYVITKNEATGKDRFCYKEEIKTKACIQFDDKE